MNPDHSISDRLLVFGIRHERDEHTHKDGRHKLWQGDVYLGRFDAGEAVDLLNDLTFGVD